MKVCGSPSRVTYLADYISGMGELIINFRGPPLNQFLERKVRLFGFVSNQCRTEFATLCVLGINSAWRLPDFVCCSTVK